MSPLTTEQRRLNMAKAREARAAKLKERSLRNGGTATVEVAAAVLDPDSFVDEDATVSSDRGASVTDESSTVVIRSGDWNTMPLDLFRTRYAEMQRELQRVGAILLQRESKVVPTWQCWTQSHQSQVNKMVVAQCKRTGPDGKWAFRDDGTKDENGRLAPTFCCSQMCYTAYIQSRPINALSRR